MAEPATSARKTDDTAVDIGALLSTSRIALGLEATSKKRLLELVTELLIADAPELNKQLVLQLLNERERLGSTGIGHGVALPHARVEGLATPVGAFAALAAPVSFDAVDSAPVHLVFALLVPAEATAAHLRILARLAQLFSNAATREELVSCRDPDRALALLSSLTANPRPA